VLGGPPIFFRCFSCPYCSTLTQAPVSPSPLNPQRIGIKDFLILPPKFFDDVFMYAPLTPEEYVALAHKMGAEAAAAIEAGEGGAAAAAALAVRGGKEEIGQLTTAAAWETLFLAK
jgi:hypothetical protein